MGKKKIFSPVQNDNPYKTKQTTPPKTGFIDFNTRRICPACGRDIKITHNFCKYCGVDLSMIEPIGNDDISKHLATTAVTDPDPGVRMEAVDTLGGFGDKKVLGLLTYVLLNDPDENVRREAADELGDLHHPYSLDIFTKALKDESPLVRKEAIEGLKKIKKKIKPKKFDEGKPESREHEKDKPEPLETDEPEPLETDEENNADLL
ncbi:MAG: HEAT repeat domain-containing protein [Candidatus Lokiarchaeota archaeon]|nr:HEAT repeat domain-containing protein [Candidatus Lokiarchaeota archaeon]